jgi:hypothetical protein
MSPDLRLWRCHEDLCPVRTWTERYEGIAPRACLSERAKAAVCRQVCVFLCAPQALYAVNRNVTGFEGYAATFELAETGVNDRHWSRR